MSGVLDSWADYYDCVCKLTHGARYQQLTDQTLGVIRQLAAPPARIVDFGAGTGRLAIPLARAGYTVTAVETSATMCRVLRAKAAAGVEGAVINHCASCRTNQGATAQQAGVKVALVNQTICRPVKKSGFDLGLCVFTVLNYLLGELGLRQFARAAARAIRADGKLLVSFVEDMRPMQQSVNGQRTNRSWDRECSVVRNINVRQLEDTLYEYHETSKLTKEGREFPYEDRFPLREWSREEITAQLKAGGFFFESDLSNEFRRTGEVYLLFRRSFPREMRPDDSMSSLPEEPKHFIKRMGAERERLRREHVLQARSSTLKLIADGGPADVFYYPACGSDLAYPLRHFSDRCGAFIFCDWTNGAENSFLDGVMQLKADRPRRIPDDARDFLHFPLDQTDVKELAALHHLLVKFFPDMDPNLATYLANPASPKGHYAELWVTAADSTTRFVRVFWFAMEAVSLYLQLFARKRKAPRILCIKGWDHNGGAWTPFGNWQAHLGKVVQVGPRKPNLLVARKGDHDWPWTLPVAEFNDWDDRPVMMWARKKSVSRSQQGRKRKSR